MYIIVNNGFRNFKLIKLYRILELKKKTIRIVGIQSSIVIQ